MGTVLPFVELALGASLLVSASGRPAAIAAAVVLALFTAAVVANLTRGRRPVCRCFGDLGAAPISGRTVARNLVLLAVAVTIAIAGGGRDPLDLLETAPVARDWAEIPKGEPTWSIW